MKSFLYDDIAQKLRNKRIFFTGMGDCDVLMKGCVVRVPWNLCLEPYCSFMTGGDLASMGASSYTWSELPDWVSVGRYCSIAGGLKFVEGRHPYERLSSSPFTYEPEFFMLKQFVEDKRVLNPGVEIDFSGEPRSDVIKNTIIGHDVWIGANVQINRGVNIGHGSVIASGSVVHKDVPPYSVVGGNPMQLIKPRFDNEVVSALLDSEWWQYDFTYFDQARKLFMKPTDVVDFIQNNHHNMVKFEPNKITYADF